MALWSWVTGYLGYLGYLMHLKWVWMPMARLLTLAHCTLIMPSVGFSSAYRSCLLLGAPLISTVWPHDGNTKLCTHRYPDGVSGTVSCLLEDMSPSLGDLKGFLIFPFSLNFCILQKQIYFEVGLTCSHFHTTTTPPPSCLPSL